jgi:hypothetical protein
MSDFQIVVRRIKTDEECIVANRVCGAWRFAIGWEQDHEYKTCI